MTHSIRINDLSPPPRVQISSTELFCFSYSLYNNVRLKACIYFKRLAKTTKSIWAFDPSVVLAYILTHTYVTQNLLTHQYNS